MIETGAPRQETVRETQSSKRPRLFEVLENPEPGWTTRKLESHRTVDNPPEWHVELIREADGATINFHHQSLHVAWLRACERAHMESNGLTEEK